MDLWKGYELSRTYVPAAYYTITSIKSKNGRANPLHDEVLGRKAYVVYLEVGERCRLWQNVFLNSLVSMIWSLMQNKKVKARQLNSYTNG